MSIGLADPPRTLERLSVGVLASHLARDRSAVVSLAAAPPLSRFFGIPSCGLTKTNASTAAIFRDEFDACCLQSMTDR
jgi:hypothetical protein